MKCKPGFRYSNRGALFLIVVITFLLTAGMACAEIPALQCEASYGVRGKTADSLGALPHHAGTLPWHDDTAPDAIQNRPFSSVSTNVLLQRHRYRVSSSANIDQMSIVGCVAKGVFDPADYLSSVKEQNFVLSPITYVKLTHKRE